MKEKRCYDGYLVKKLDPVVFMMPYVMPRRTDSEVMVDLRLDLAKVEAFIRENRKNIPDLTLYHFIFASLVRAAAVTPQINRFITGNRIYQRRAVRISMMVKKRLEIEGKESTIYPTFENSDTLEEIVRKTKTVTDEAFAKLDAESNGFDHLVGLLYAAPAWLLRFCVKILMFMDRYGKLPRALVDLQPFHSAFFVTNVGSIGLPVIYHHLYEFGTTSGFLSIGKKEIVTTITPKGVIKTKKILPIKLVLDGRICDGYTYSCAFRTIRKCFEHPEWLLESYRPEQAAISQESKSQPGMV